MSKRAANRLNRSLQIIRHLLPAWLLFAVAAALDHPLALVPILIANAIMMTGLSNAIGFGMESSFMRSLARRGLAFFVLSTVYTAFVAAVIAVPAWWLLREGSLAAALTLSAAVVAALFALWRIWPTFALPFVWDDAYPVDDRGHSWLLVALRRCIAFARHLTSEHEIFFGHGLPACLALTLLAVGALLLSGLGGVIGGDARVAAVVLYAGVLAPLALGLLLNRCLHALLANARRSHRVVDESARTQSAGSSGTTPCDVASADLDATLLCAAHSAQISLALAALERGGDPNAVPGPAQRDQRSALMVAVSLADLRLLRALIAKGADVNRLQGGISPLIAATRDTREGRPDAVTTLLSNGADPRIADPAGDTPLHHAARCAEPAIAALLIDAGAEVDAVNGEGVTPLGLACANASWSIASFLIERGAKVDLERAQPALLFAAGIGEDDPAGVKLLLKQRADANARAALQRTPLMAAALAGHARIIEALLGAGADPDACDDRGTTSLMEAARAGSAAAVHALAKRTRQIDALDHGGRSALAIACQSRHASEECVRALLTLGADRTIVGADGRRALDHAAAAGRWHIVAMLDAAYPLPSNLGDGTPNAPSASADHLLDALRFGHWNIADEFAAVLHEWSPEALADLYVDLAEPAHERARDWLLNHGLGGDARTADGRLVSDALIEKLPESLESMLQWIDRGAPFDSASVLARILARAPHGADGHAVRTLARALLECGADWCGSGADQRTALHLAVAAADVGLSQTLLDRGADPNARDTQGRTPLHLAIALGSEHAPEFARRLIRAGASPEIATAVGETPLGQALARKQPEVARWLTWTQWRLPSRRLQAADLPAAASLGDLGAVERLLALGLPIDAEDPHGASALIRAAGSGHTALVVALLEAGADASRVAHAGVHCLAAAVSAKRESVVRTLLDHGVTADMPMAGGGTALIVAAALGHTRIAAALLEAGADSNASDEQSTTPLHALAQHAFDGGDLAEVRVLLDTLLRAGARLDARNCDGQDPLLILLGARAQPGVRCNAEHLLQLLALLIERGAMIDSQDHRGVGALHACALHGLNGCARLLKAHGAPLDLRDGFERSAADVAALLGYVDVASVLGAPAAPLPSVRQTLRRPARASD